MHFGSRLVVAAVAAAVAAVVAADLVDTNAFVAEVPLQWLHRQ